MLFKLNVKGSVISPYMRKKLDEFAYLASHDLQEPLRKIGTLSEFLRLRYHDALGKEGAQYIDMILSSVNNMRGIIDSLLQFTDLDSKTPEFVPLKLNEVVADVLADQQLKISETGATIDVRPLPDVEGVASEIRLLMNNLISNSLKFVSGTKPNIKVESSPLDDHDKVKLKLTSPARFFKISVSDNGIGFEKEFCELIFGVFQRLNAKSEYAGSGIGLATCKKIADRHHSLIFAESELGKGSTFSLVIPEHQIANG
ncbi:MAG TPA: ATP-binding protein [Cyclobacteriaceae bacterium]|nr:ATP-binding protein [Cyclobacteriaceae bacterium]